MILYCDTETRSEINLKTHGVAAYAEGKEADVMLWAYAIDDGEIQVWDRTETKVMPADLAEALVIADEQVWQNSFFDRTMLRVTMGIELDTRRIWDTMVQALAHGLPASLDKLCQVFKLDAADAKDKEGSKYIHLFCKPRPANSAIRWATRKTHPVEWERFKEYAKGDIRSMRILRKRMPTWNFVDNNQLRERTLWCLDQKINDRGILMDLELADAALKAVADNKVILDAQTEEWTGGDVQSATQRDALLAHILKEHGVTLPDMKGATLEKRIKDESLPQAVRDLLANRVETATTSTSKYKKLRQVVSHDGRARGLLQFCGAGRTGRDAGRLWQPQNLPRPTMTCEAIELGIELLKHDPAMVPLVWSVPKLASNALRGSIIAPPGRKLVVSDLSNIEGVTAAWLAGEDWKLQAYREVFADDTKPDLYRLAYGRSFGVDPMSISKAQRQLGKIQELALAYEGGVGAFVTFVLTYRMDLAVVAAAVLPVLSPDVYKSAVGMLNWRRQKGMSVYGLTDEVFIACEALKYLWRQAHPAISSYWKELETAAIRAVLHPGQEFEARRLSFVKNGSWLRMILPSTRSVCYPSAQVRDGKLYYQGINQYTHQWGWIGTYGGKIFENACQAVARDVLFGHLEEIEAAGFDILLRVHDENITEADDDPRYSAELLSEIMARPLWWSEGLPLKAAGFEAYRYKKDD